MTAGEVLPALPEEDLVPAPVTRTSTAVEVRQELSVDELVERSEKIHQALQRAMKQDEHYGVIPGTNKPTLLKPGAEKLMTLFMLDPEYRIDQSWHEEHLTVTAYCTLFHIPTGNRVASGVGLCSTREEKYAYRTAMLKCPDCGAEAIVKRNKQKTPNDAERFICVGKDKGGCWHKFASDDERITGQEVGKIPNEQIADTYNTVVKMACKRALIAAVLNGTAASDVFTQDLEDTQGSGEGDQAGSASPEARSDHGPPVADPNAGEPSPGTSQPSATERRMKLESRMNDLLSALIEARDDVDWPATLQKKAQETFGADKRDDLTTDQLEGLCGVMEKWLAQAVPA